MKTILHAFGSTKRLNFEFREFCDKNKEIGCRITKYTVNIGYCVFDNQNERHIFKVVMNHDCIRGYELNDAKIYDLYNYELINEIKTRIKSC